MSLERFRSIAANIISEPTPESPIPEAIPPAEAERCLVYQMPDGHQSFTPYETNLDSATVSQELTEGGNIVLGSYTVVEAKELLDKHAKIEDIKSSNVIPPRV